MMLTRMYTKRNRDSSGINSPTIIQHFLLKSKDYFMISARTNLKNQVMCGQKSPSAIAVNYCVTMSLNDCTLPSVSSLTR